MKQYIAPQLQICPIDSDDIISTSFGGENGDCYVYDDYDPEIWN